MNRRSFLAGLLATVTSPIEAVGYRVRRTFGLIPPSTSVPQAGMTFALQDELSAITRKAFVPRLHVQLYAADATLQQMLDRPPSDII